MMNVFPVSSAQHFCAKFRPVSAHTTSLKSYLRQGNFTSLKEGSKDFEEFAAHLLRDAERCLFLAASQYRRSLDLMISSSAHWAHVTLYYGAFYAASAFLGMFGGWIDAPYLLVEVAKSSPGIQQLIIHRDKRRYPSLRLPPHKAFWHEFYSACNPLITYVKRDLQFAVEPISSDPNWLTDNRNEVNYDSTQALDLSNGFRHSFCETGFPKCLPGRLNTQFQVTEALVKLAFSYAKQFNVSTDGLDVLGSAASRRVRIKDMIFDAKHPSLKASAEPHILV